MKLWIKGIGIFKRTVFVCFSLVNGLTLKVLNFWKFTSYCSLKLLWSGMGEVVLARTSPTLHPPSPPTVHQLSQLALWELSFLSVSAARVIYHSFNWIMGTGIFKRSFLVCFSMNKRCIGLTVMSYYLHRHLLLCLVYFIIYPCLCTLYLSSFN